MQKAWIFSDVSYDMLLLIPNQKGELFKLLWSRKLAELAVVTLASASIVYE